MKAFYFSEVGKASLIEIEKPKLQNETDAIVKVTLTAICGSDIHLKYGHIPTTPGYVLGHEYVGVVEQIGEGVTDIKVGDRVVGAGTPFCRECENCKSGHIYRCTNGGIFGSGKENGNLNGSHAEYMRIPFADNTLLKIPNELTDEQVLFTGDILATGYHAVTKSGVNANSTVVIFGAGPVGLCAVATAKLFNSKKIILVEDKNRYRVEAGLKYGATDIILASETDVVSEIYKLTNGNGASALIDAAGSQDSIQNAVNAAAIGGHISIVGIAGDIVVPMFTALLKNLRFDVGLVDLSVMPELLDFIKRKKIDVTGIITHRMALSDIEQAFDIFEGRKENVIKIAIKP